MYPLPERLGPPTRVNISIHDENPQLLHSRQVSISWLPPTTEDRLYYIVTITNDIDTTSSPLRENIAGKLMLTVALEVGNYTVNITGIDTRCNLTNETEHKVQGIPVATSL